jgi:hypothetical protein
MRGYGYTADDRIVAEEASVVAAGADLIDAGATLKHALRHANELSAAAGGPQFDSRSLKRILTSPRVAGLKLDKSKGELVPSGHDAILARAKWERVCAILGAPDRANGGPTRERVYLLTGGIALCECGTRLYAAILTSSKTRSEPGYRCLKNMGGCGRIRINRDLLDGYVAPHVLAAAIADARSGGGLAKAAEQAAADAKQARDFLAGARVLERELAELLASRELSPQAYGAATRNLAIRVTDAENVIKAEPRMAALRDVESMTAWWNAADLEDRRAFTVFVVRDVTVRAAPVRGRGAAKRVAERVTIHYRTRRDDTGGTAGLVPVTAELRAAGASPTQPAVTSLFQAPVFTDNPPSR